MKHPLSEHVRALKACRRCPGMRAPPISGGAVVSRVMLVGQAPGVKEPELQRPFAWTAGRTLFRWFDEACGIDEQTFRKRVYISAVCRCFPGKAPSGGGDRVPNRREIATCRSWLEREFELLQPRLVLPVGRLAITQFLPTAGKLVDVVGQQLPLEFGGVSCDLIPLPHPSGASTWHRTEPGRSLTAAALRLATRHEEFRRLLAP